ncbi:MAG TPA: ChbG/HpnK family deacetylase [Chloroflexota bacterium]|nr:ChbG/HpnK family deacetylase [Chloroflexota bacterium]
MANPALRRLGFAPDDRVLIIHADDVGMCHATLPAVVEGAEPAAVATEMRGQLDRALGAGIDVTHLDAHTGAALAAPFRADYVRLGLERGIPPFLPRLDAAGQRRWGLSGAEAAAAVAFLQEMEDRGLPLFDHFTSLPLYDPRDQIACAKARLDALPPGLSLMIFHPARDSDELRAITPDWPSRVANYETFTSPEVRDYLTQRGIQLIGYRALRSLLPSA